MNPVRILRGLRALAFDRRRAGRAVLLAACLAGASADLRASELVLTPLDEASVLARADGAGSRAATRSPSSVAASTDAQPGRAPRPGQLPMSRIAVGTRDIAAAWLARPTDRYPHGALGDALEAAQLVVERRDGTVLELELPPSRVFEDLEPRLFDLDGDGRDEIILVESDLRLGASVAVYGIGADGLGRRAASEFIGRANRWLNPVGAGDFDGDGRPDIAVVLTPHIGGILRLFRFTEPLLEPFADHMGVSTHSFGSFDLAMGRVVDRRPRDRLLLPDQAHRRMRLLEWTDGAIEEVASVELPAPLASGLTPIGPNRWRLRLDDGRRFELQAR